jgi:hypothetical protein
MDIAAAMRQAETSLQPLGAQRVHGRNSDDAFIADRVSWTPAMSLEIGLEQTYRWIDDQMTAP